MHNCKRMVAVKYSKLKGGFLQTLFATTLLVKAATGIAADLAAHTPAVLDHCFLTACAINAQQLAQQNSCRLNVTLALALYQAYEQATGQDPMQERQAHITAPAMFASLSVEQKQTLFENLDQESRAIILEVPATQPVHQVPLTCYLIAAYRVATDQEKRSTISANFKKFLTVITAKQQQTNKQAIDLLVTLDIATKEYLYQLLDIHSAHFIKNYIKQRCAAAAHLVDHRNNLPL